MAQCKAQTISGSRCTLPVRPPSQSLCAQHQKSVAGGSTVRNAETGRKFQPPRRWACGPVGRTTSDSNSRSTRLLRPLGAF